MSLFAPPDDTLPLLTQFRQLDTQAKGHQDELRLWYARTEERLSYGGDAGEQMTKTFLLPRADAIRWIQWPVAHVMDALADDIDAGGWPLPDDTERIQRLEALDAAMDVILVYSRSVAPSWKVLRRADGVGRLICSTEKPMQETRCEQELLNELWRITRYRKENPVRRCERCGFSFVVTQAQKTHCSVRCSIGPVPASP